MHNKITEFLQKIQDFWHNLDTKREFGNISIAVVVLIIAALPVVIYLVSSNRSQIIKSKASENQVELFFATPEDPTPLTQLNLPAGTTKTLALYLDAKNKDISGFDIRLNLGTGSDNITINSADEGKDASLFDTLIHKTYKDGNIRFTKVKAANQQPAKGVLHLGSVTFTAKPEARGSGTITVSDYQITTALSDTALTAGVPTLTYSFSGAIKATIVGPTGVSENAPFPLVYGATAQGANLSKVEIFWAKTQSDLTKGGSWTKIGSTECGTGSNCELSSASFTPPGAGTYYVAVNAYTKNKGPWCSGNPAVREGKLTQSGLNVCDPEGKDVIKLQVDGTIPNQPPVSPQTPSPTPAVTVSQAPTATITGIAQANINSPFQLTYQGRARGNNLSKMEIYLSSTQSDLTKGSSWKKLGQTKDCEGKSSCTIDISVWPGDIPLSTGTYYVTVNAHTKDNGPWCSGSPAVINGTVTASNLTVCDAGSENYITLTVR